MIITDRISEGPEVMRSPLPIRPSICFHSMFGTDWPLTLNFCVWVGHDCSSPAIEGQGHGSGYCGRSDLSGGMGVFRGGPWPLLPSPNNFFQNFLFLLYLSSVGKDASELHRNCNQNAVFWGGVCNTVVLSRHRDNYYCQDYDVTLFCSWNFSVNVNAAFCLRHCVLTKTLYSPIRAEWL